MFLFLLFGVLGVFGAVLASAIRRSIATRSFTFTGESSIALFPFWGLIPFLYPIVGIHLGGVPWYGRGAIYAAILCAAQILVGLLLDRIHLCPWKSPGKGSFKGLIRLTDVPAWFAAGLAIEWIYPWVRGMAK